MVSVCEIPVDGMGPGIATIIILPAVDDEAVVLVVVEHGGLVDGVINEVFLSDLFLKGSEEEA